MITCIKLKYIASVKHPQICEGEIAKMKFDRFKNCPTVSNQERKGLQKSFMKFCDKI